MVARGGPPPGLGIRHDARPRAVVRAWFRPDDASVPLRGQRPVRLAPERRRRGDRAVPDRFTGATHVGDAPTIGVTSPPSPCTTRRTPSPRRCGPGRADPAPRAAFAQRPAPEENP